MYASTFYFLKRTKEKVARLVYGYGLDIGEQKPSALVSSFVNGTPKGWNLIRLSGTLTKNELNKYLTEWHQNQSQTWRTETLQFPEWIKRPTVYSYDNEIHRVGLKSLTSRTSFVDMYFAMNKSKWLTELFPIERLDKDRAKKEMKELDKLINNETGISLLSTKSSFRFGNIEVYTSTDDLSLIKKETGVHLTMKREKKYPGEKAWKGEYVTTGASLWVDDSLSNYMPITVNLSLTNDHGNREATILDKVATFHQVGETRDFLTNEPISGYQIKVWSKEGHLLHHEDTSLIRSVHMDMNIRGATKYIRDPWSEKLPKKYKQQVEMVETYSRRPIKIDTFSFDPWVSEGDLFEKTINAIHDPNNQTSSRFFPATQEGETQFFFYLQSLLEDKVVKKAIFVDPYFGHESIAQFLSRLKTNLPVEIITSLSNKRIDDKPSPLESLKDFIHKNKTLIHHNMEIINVQSKQAIEQQFHDRFILLQTENGDRGFMLGTSFHSIGQKFPGIMIEIPPSMLEDVTSYIDELRDGNITGRKDAKSQILFSGSKIQPPTPTNNTTLPYGLKPFPGWEIILSLLSNGDGEAISSLEECINKGVFEEFRGTYTWEVTAEKKEAVIQTIKEKILEQQNDNSELRQLFNALAFWNYYGSNISAEDLVVTHLDLTDFLITGLAAIQTQLTDTINRNDQRWFTLKRVFEGFDESVTSYRDFYALVQYSYEYERLLKQDVFYASYLYHLNADAYFLELDQKLVLLPHFLYLLNRNHHFNNTANKSKIAERLLLFHALKRNKYHLFHEFPSTDIKKKVLLTYLGMLLKEKHWNENLTIHLPYLESTIFTDEVSPFILKIKQPFLIELLDKLVEQQPDFVSTVRAKMLERWAENIIKKEPYSFHYAADFEELKRIVYIMLEQHGEKWTEWYTNNLIKKLPWHRYRNPLLKSSQYSKWHSDSNKLLLGLFTGLNALEKVSTTKEASREEKEIIGSIFAYFKDYLHPSIWEVPFDQLLLDDVLYSLAMLSENYGLHEEHDELLKLIENKSVPQVRKLSVYFSSQSVFKERIEQINKLLNNDSLVQLLGEQSIGRLKWISDVLQVFKKNCKTDIEAQNIRAIQSTIMNLIKLASDDMLRSLWRLDLRDPMELDNQWGKWADTLKVMPHELKTAWTDKQGYDFFLKLIGLGIYLNGNIQEFQQWLHEKHHGLRQTEWERILNGRGQRVLEELYREFSGLGV